MTPDADVYQGGNLVAHLSRTARGTRLSFLDDSALDRGRLAVHLPKTQEPIDSTDLPPFFLNLLPEGARLRLLLDSARAKDDSLGLLLQVGWDTIGDVAVIPHGADLAKHRIPSGTGSLDQVDFWELFRAGIGDPADASVPGVQEKISAATVAFGVRLAHVPSAILKLNPPAYPRLVENEAFFLSLARSCGIETNVARVVHDRRGESGLLVERFDRRREGRQVRKLHQEDACQLLDTVPARKYELSMRRVADAIVEQCSAPAIEIERLLRLYAFSYVIGNADLHAKNISLLWDRTVRLTPAYDLLSTLPYPQLDRHMALKLDGRDDNFRGTHFAEFGKHYGVPERAILAMITKICRGVEAWIPRFGDMGFDAAATDRLQREVASRIGNLRR